MKTGTSTFEEVLKKEQRMQLETVKERALMLVIETMVADYRDNNGKNIYKLFEAGKLIHRSQNEEELDEAILRAFGRRSAYLQPE